MVPSLAPLSQCFTSGCRAAVFEELTAKDFQKFGNDGEQNGRQHDNKEMSPGRIYLVEFVSQQYDVLIKFKVEPER